MEKFQAHFARTLPQTFLRYLKKVPKLFVDQSTSGSRSRSAARGPVCQSIPSTGKRLFKGFAWAAAWSLELYVRCVLIQMTKWYTCANTRVSVIHIERRESSWVEAKTESVKDWKKNPIVHLARSKTSRTTCHCEFFSANCHGIVFGSRWSIGYRTTKGWFDSNLFGHFLNDTAVILNFCLITSITILKPRSKARPHLLFIRTVPMKSECENPAWTACNALSKCIFHWFLNHKFQHWEKNKCDHVFPHVRRCRARLRRDSRDHFSKGFSFLWWLAFEVAVLTWRNAPSARPSM